MFWLGGLTPRNKTNEPTNVSSSLDTLRYLGEKAECQALPESLLPPGKKEKKRSLVRIPALPNLPAPDVGRVPRAGQLGTVRWFPGKLSEKLSASLIASLSEKLSREAVSFSDSVPVREAVRVPSPGRLVIRRTPGERLLWGVCPKQGTPPSPWGGAGFETRHQPTQPTFPSKMAVFGPRGAFRVGGGGGAPKPNPSLPMVPPQGMRSSLKKEAPTLSRAGGHLQVLGIPPAQIARTTHAQ